MSCTKAVVRWAVVAATHTMYIGRRITCTCIALFVCDAPVGEATKFSRSKSCVDRATSARRCFPRMYGTWDRTARRSEPSRWIVAVADFRERRRLVHRRDISRHMRCATRRPTCRVTRPACGRRRWNPCVTGSLTVDSVWRGAFYSATSAVNRGQVWVTSRCSPNNGARKKVA